MSRLPRVLPSAACRALLLAAVLIAPAHAGSSQIYQKKDTWVQTMLAARAALAQLRQAVPPANAKDGAALQPLTSEKVAGDGPGQLVSVSVRGASSMRLLGTLIEGGGNCQIWGDARLIAADGSQTPLGTLTPSYVSVGWGELLVDQNWLKKPLAIGPRTFEHGIWVHAPSDVCYPLGKKYERFEAWVGMDVNRAQGTAQFQVLFDTPDAAPQLAARTAHDFPLQSKWLAADSGRKHELDWFHDASSRTDDTLIGRALAGCGPAPALRKEYEQLRRQKTSYDDPGWLELYARACRYRESFTAAGAIWLVELREALLARLDALAEAGTSADDPQWAALEQGAGRLAGGETADQDLRVAGLRPSIAALSQALPGRLPGAEALSGRAAALESRLAAASPALVQAQEAALAELPALLAEARALRRGMLESLPAARAVLATAGGAEMDCQWRQQYRTLCQDLARREHIAGLAAETFRCEALIQESDRDPVDVVLRRTAALLADLRTRRAPRDGKPHAEREEYERQAADLAALQAAAGSIAPEQAEARLALFAEVCAVRRRIALGNPLLDFDQIVFIKRHRALFNHMCDQYYGMAATPGGGLYVLSGAFGPQPQLRDVLADAVVERGRLAGQKLSGGPATPPAVTFDGQGNRRGEDTGGGTFLSPDLSYDGTRVLFAYVENRGDPNHHHHTDPTQGHWDAGHCYHVFRVNLDGTGLEQLTDGTWNDFDPCWLPNGRVAFISERRGGYLRCGRVCPNYNLFDMAADGGDIQCLSFHETNEWQPSVTNDGRILYTRWDYVDRFGCTAHHPWITTLDGRDSRAVHGNFAPRRARTDMELDCRAIPGSPRLVATAAPHHGQAYGSLVLVDPRVEDDDAMSPVRRITPEVDFPESQGGGQVYGSAWPLSEDYYLCVYDAAMDPNTGRQGGGYRRGEYGIYLLDSFGNKELLYRDPEIACLNPVPVRARALPPLMPEMSVRRPESNPAVRPTLPAPAHEPQATVAVVNVYQSALPWPSGTEIKALRVLQVLPMSVPSGSLRPHETGLREPSARDSVVPVRYVLGTVPVEADGSAHFVVPANKEMFFQALDERGLAVQSMRSATYFHEGERLLCQGCHEPNRRSPPLPAELPQAFEREPSRLAADVDGSNPFSYPRLVQPVLDKHCVDCHAKEKACNLAREPVQRHWFASYNSLAEKYGFWDYHDGLRTTPGQFGARASKLYELLTAGHHGVQLSPEELHRLTLWLDCVSMFYGVYEKEGGEAQLRGEVVRPTLE